MDIWKQTATSLDHLRKWFHRPDRQHGGQRGAPCGDETPPTDDRRLDEQVQAAGTEETVKPLDALRNALQDDPAIAQRARFWANKFLENRSRSLEAHQKQIQAKLLQEFPRLDRKSARLLAQNVTRDWA